MNQISYLIIASMATAVLTITFKELFKRFGGTLYTSIRGGTPRAVGIAPYLVLVLFFPPPGSYLIALIGAFAFFDDIIGRKKIKGLSMEYGQFSRGVGMIMVMALGYLYFGPVAILIALMIQPLNIADMQPGSACSTVIIMSILVTIGIFTFTTFYFYPALILLAICIGYAPLDYKGKIMMGEIGNHSFAVGLGVLYAYFGSIIGYFTGFGFYGFIITLILFMITVFLIAFIRRKNLKNFLETKLEINEPCFGDYFMDVLTGGGLGDIFRRILVGKRSITIKNRLLIVLGFRRLVYNPHSH